MRLLGPYLNEPTVKGPVREYVKQLGAPFTLGEIWRPLGIGRQKVRRELNRMVDAGLLTRRQVMLPRNSGFGVGIMAPMYLYSLAEGYE